MDNKNIETKLREMLCPCSNSYYDIQGGYKVCKASTNDCMIYKIMKAINETQNVNGEANEFIKNYRFCR